MAFAFDVSKVEAKGSTLFSRNKENESVGGRSYA